MSQLSLHFYFLLILSIALMGLALWMLSKYQKLPAIRYYGGFLLSLSLIAIIQALLFLPFPSQMLLLLTKLGYLSGALTFSMLLVFSLYFLVPSKNLSANSKLIWIILIVFFVPFILFNPFFLLSVTQVAGGIQENAGTMFILFPLFVAIYSVWTIINLIKKLPYLQPGQKNDMGVFIAALVIATLLGVIFDVILPATGKPRVPIGIYSSTVLFGLSTYIVLKK